MGYSTWVTNDVIAKRNNGGYRRKNWQIYSFGGRMGAEGGQKECQNSD